MHLNNNYINTLKGFLSESALYDICDETPFLNVKTYTNVYDILTLPIFMKYHGISKSVDVLYKISKSGYSELSTVYKMFCHLNIIKNTLYEISVGTEAYNAIYYISQGFIMDSAFNPILAVCRDYCSKGTVVGRTLYISTKIYDTTLDPVEKFIKNTLLPNIDIFIDSGKFNSAKIVKEMPFEICNFYYSTLAKHENDDVSGLAKDILDKL